MKTAFYIARRYLISKKSVNVINIISGVSIAGVTVGTFALVLILSIFNGLDTTIKTMFSSFDPNIKISATIGKSFVVEQEKFEAIGKLPGVRAVTPVIEEDAMLRYGERQYFATIKGVPVNYLETSSLDSSMIVMGKFILESDHIPYAVVGQGVAYFLSTGLNYTDPIHIYTLKRGLRARPSINDAFIHSTIFTSGIFANQQEIDSKYVLVPFEYAKDIFQMNDRVSAVEVSLEKGVSDKELESEIASILGKEFAVKTQYEQHELFYRVMRSERWAIFMILSFILVIASFNILGSLTMLILDKKPDIAILQSMGANEKLVRTIFLFEGWMISIVGVIFGLILGILACWIQMEFGILKVPGNEAAFIFTSYPVEIRLTDLVSIVVVVCSIGFLAAWYPIRFISGKHLSGDMK